MTGTEFRTRRKELGQTQRSMAELMHIDSNTVARWERGEIAVNDGLAALAFEVIALRRLRDSFNAAPPRRQSRS